MISSEIIQESPQKNLHMLTLSNTKFFGGEDLTKVAGLEEQLLNISKTSEKEA